MNEIYNMSTEVVITIISTVGGIIVSALGAARYTAITAKKSQEAVLRMVLDHSDKKNGHLERISKEFAEASKLNSEATARLATEIALLGAKLK